MWTEWLSWRKKLPIGQHASEQSQGPKGIWLKQYPGHLCLTRVIPVSIMADLLGSDDFQEDPAAEFLAREQDDLAELGEDFGEEQPEANVSSSES